MILFVAVLVLAVTTAVAPAPIAARGTDLDSVLGRFLDELYERLYPGDVFERMQGDQPQESETSTATSSTAVGGVSTPDAANMTDYFRTSRNRAREPDGDDRAKDNWIQMLKENILHQIGRSNMTTTSAQNFSMSPMNTSLIPDIFNGTIFDGDQITEKIRSYYPSCDAPTNMDQDMWRDDKIMNLFFNKFDQTDEKGMNIATATLRLYRLPSNVTKTPRSGDCDNSTSTEEEKLLRVSIYWYTRSVRKKRVKKRLCDSKVIQENSRWVELSVKPATRAWSRGRNLGLAVVVEDQDGTQLKADQLFKGAQCMVGASTPKPIPTIIIDAARQSNDLDRRIHNLLGRDSGASLSGDVPMLPTIDICTLEFPENYSQTPRHLSNLRINACNLKKNYEHAQLLAERDKLERLATLPEVLSPRHIRHQRQHLKHSDFDPRSNIVNKRILTSEELQALNLNITVDR